VRSRCLDRLDGVFNNY